MEKNTLNFIESVVSILELIESNVSIREQLLCLNKESLERIKNDILSSNNGSTSKKQLNNDENNKEIIIGSLVNLILQKKENLDELLYKKGIKFFGQKCLKLKFTSNESISSIIGKNILALNLLSTEDLFDVLTKFNLIFEDGVNNLEKSKSIKTDNRIKKTSSITKKDKITGPSTFDTWKIVTHPEEK